MYVFITGLTYVRNDSILRNMDYVKHYNLLMERARNRKAICYVERHHIIPRCMGGSDDPSNLVELTAEEHYVAHQLLVKMYPNNHLILYAARMMTIDNKVTGVSRTKNKLYGWLKRRVSVARRSHVPWNKGKKMPPRSEETRSKLSLAGKKRTQTEETKRKIAAARTGKKHTEDTRARLSAAKLGITRSQETKDKISLATRGKLRKPLSEQTKAKISATKRKGGT